MAISCCATDATATMTLVQVPSCPDAYLPRAAGMLSPREQTRANAFHRRADRAEFITAHAALRCVLSTYVNAPPESLIFRQHKDGKPYLDRRAHPCSVEFNLSHSGGYALIAVSDQGSPVGIDLEQRKGIDDLANIARRFFHLQERRYILATRNSDQRHRRFYQIWTIKEACLKAFGIGLGSIDLANFSALPPPGLARNIAIPVSITRELHCYAYILNVDDAFHACLATPSPVELCDEPFDWTGRFGAISY